MYYNVYMNHNDQFYGKANIGRLYIQLGKTVKMSFKGKILQEMGSRTEFQ